MNVDKERKILNSFFSDFCLDTDSLEECGQHKSGQKDELHRHHNERWAHFVKTHPDGWRAIHNSFIDAQYAKAYAYIRELAKQKNGKEKIVKLYGIKNLKGYPQLLGNKFTDFKPTKWGKRH